jgi:hypothetical protein
MNDVFTDAIRDTIVRNHAGEIYAQRASIASRMIDPSMMNVRDIRLPLSAEASVLFDLYEPQVMLRAEGWGNKATGERLGVQKLFTYQGIRRDDIPGAVAMLTEHMMRMLADQLMRGKRNDGL